MQGVSRGAPERINVNTTFSRPTLQRTGPHQSAVTADTYSEIHPAPEHALINAIILAASEKGSGSVSQNRAIRRVRVFQSRTKIELCLLKLHSE